MEHRKPFESTLTSGSLPIFRMHFFKNSMTKKILMIVVMNGMINLEMLKPQNESFLNQYLLMCCMLTCLIHSFPLPCILKTFIILSGFFFFCKYIKFVLMSQGCVKKDPPFFLHGMEVLLRCFHSKLELYQACQTLAL